MMLSFIEVLGEVQIVKKKYHTWLPCVKGAVTVRYNVFGIALSIRLKMCRTVPSFPSL